MTDSDIGTSTVRSSRRGRRVLAGIALVLACLAILLSTVAVWAHQTLFDTDRFTAVVTKSLDEPAVIDPLASRISIQVVDALDVQGRIASRLPGPSEALAAPITLAITDAIDKRLQVALLNPRVQAGLAKVVSFTHARVVDLLRGDPDAVTVKDGYVVVSVFPVVQAALEELQSIGLLPDGVQIPDLSSGDPPAILSGRLATALGITLPPDFGTIQLMKADRLLAARSAVQAFDAIVIVLLIVTLLLILLTLWLSTSRLRMLLFLGLGTIIAFALAKLAIGAIEDLVLSGVAEGDLVGAIRAVVDATVADLRVWASVVLVAAVILVVLAFVVGLRGADGTIRRDRRVLERIGLVAIIFAILWIAAGLDVALLAAALIIGLGLLAGVFTPSSDPVVPVGEG